MIGSVQRVLSAVLILVGVGLLVYNLLGFQKYGEVFVWEEHTRAWAAVGAVALVGGLLLWPRGK